MLFSTWDVLYCEKFYSVPLSETYVNHYIIFNMSEQFQGISDYIYGL